MPVVHFSLREKFPNTELLLVHIFCIRTEYGKYGPEITLHLGTFHPVFMLHFYATLFLGKFAGNFTGKSNTRCSRKIKETQFL